MARESLVAVSYPVDDEFTRINTGVLDGSARVVFLHGRPEDEVRETMRRADVLIGWHLGQELPAGTWQDVPRLRFAPGPLPEPSDEPVANAISPTPEEEERARAIAAVIGDENLRERVQKAVCFSLARERDDPSI